MALKNVKMYQYQYHECDSAFCQALVLKEQFETPFPKFTFSVNCWLILCAGMSAGGTQLCQSIWIVSSIRSRTKSKDDNNPTCLITKYETQLFHDTFGLFFIKAAFPFSKKSISLSRLSFSEDSVVRLYSWVIFLI